MASEPSLKVAIIGPKEGGKSWFVNHVTAQGFPDNHPYDPTVGVRIVPHVQEIEVQEPIDAEVWDCSGDQQYEACWPAILKDLAGVLVVFRPQQPGQAADARVWCEWFCLKAGLGKGQAVMLALTDDASVTHAPLLIHNGEFSVPIVNVSCSPGADGAPSSAQRAFGKVLHSVKRRKAARQAQAQAAQ